MSSDFVTDDTPFINENEQKDNLPAVNQKENIKGVFVAGWVLAFLLPFVGVIINIWLVKNANRYTYNKIAAIAALIVSIFCSFALLLLLFAGIYNFSVA
jgi:hypothetical protein